MTTVTHIVLFRFKPEITDLEIHTIFELLAGLQAKIPQIQSFTWGRYESQEGLNQGFTHGFVMTFDSQLSRDQYLTHPDHIEVADFIGPHLSSFPEGVIAFDSCFT